MNMNMRELRKLKPYIPDDEWEELMSILNSREIGEQERMRALTIINTARLRRARWT